MHVKPILSKKTEIVIIYLVAITIILVSFFFRLSLTLENDFIIDSKGLYLHLVTLIVICLPLILFIFKLNVSIVVLIVYIIAVLFSILLNTIWLNTENITIDVFCNIIWGLVISLLAFSIFIALKIKTTKAFTYFLFSVFMTITIGYFIEFIEYIIDTELNTNLQKYKDTLGLIQLSNIALKDTIFDIFSVFVGGALSSFVISLRILKSKKVPLSIIISSKENYSRLEKIKDKEIELIYTDEPYDKTKTRFNE